MRRLLQSNGVEVIHLGHDRSAKEVLWVSLKKNPTISASGDEFLSEVLIAYQWDSQSGSAAIAFFGKRRERGCRSCNSRRRSSGSPNLVPPLKPHCCAAFSILQRRLHGIARKRYCPPIFEQIEKRGMKEVLSSHFSKNRLR